MADSFFTIAAPSEAKYTEKMSRFLAFAAPVQSVAEAKGFISKVANDYHDARHVCWAYMLGPEMNEFQLNDNGEPSGTAGKPILGQIRSHGVTDVLVVVVRYFGGIKLGTSGLIAAYREAASLALDDAGRREMYRMVEALVEVPYVSADGVMRIIKDEGMGVEVKEREFDNLCRLMIAVRADMAENILGRIEKVDGVMLTRLL